MPKKPKKKLTPAQRAARKRRKQETMIIFIRGKQVRVRREPTIDGLEVDEFIRRNADPIWLHEHGEHEILHERFESRADGELERDETKWDEDDGIPF
jgi:hypothetical protein